MTHDSVLFLRALTRSYSRYTSVMRLVTIVLLLCGGAFAQEVGYGRGQLHPDFYLPKLDGTFGRLSDYRGKNVVLINFASW